MSLDVNAPNKWKKTVHIYAKLRMELANKIKLSTSSVHKETTPSCKKLHLSHVKALKDQLKSYGYDPFEGVPARNITNGVEIEPEKEKAKSSGCHPRRSAGIRMVIVQ